MKKAIKIILLVVAVVIIALIGGLFFLVNAENITPAYLNIKEGIVQVDTGSGWTAARDGMELKLSDKVRTLDGKAKIILFESAIVTLEEDTEVSIKELAQNNVSIRQESGMTWNKFTGLSGIENYEVETPNTVATVRGTEFGVSIDEVIVANGKVQVRSGDQMLLIIGGKKAVLDENGTLVEMDLDAEDIALIRERLVETLSDLKELRWYIIKKYDLIYSQVKSRYDLTDQDVEDYLNKIDRGEIDDRDLLAKSPFEIKPAQRLIALNDKIKEQMNAISLFEPAS